MSEDAKGGQAAAKAWLTQAGRLGRRAGLPVVLFGLSATGAAIGQAFCAASVLSAALTAREGVGLASWASPRLLAAFAILAVLRAVLSVLADRAAFTAGAAARRRLRSDVLSRLLRIGPSLLRRTHSVELTAIVVDRVEALDGLFARWLPASMLALAAPALVAFAALLADPVAALVLVAAGLLVPLGMALAGIGAAAASRRQFLALGRLQVRFVDRIRGIATIVLAGRAEDEARALAAAAGELRRRTMRVLRVAFLSSATLDLAAAGALVALALHYGAALLEGRMTSPAMALFALLLVP